MKRFRAPARVRRKVGGVVAAAVLSATAVACGGLGGNAKNQLVSSANLPKCPLSALDSATGTINVSIWHGWTSQPKAGLDNAVKAFNAQQDAAQKSGKQRYKIHVSASQEGKDYDAADWIRADTVADAIVGLLDLPRDATVPELVIRPAG